MKSLYYICRPCGNIITKIQDSGIPVECCGEQMEELIPGTTDGSMEAHVPVIHHEGSWLIVKVGTKQHPMTPGHYIQWISVITDRGQQWKYLHPGELPEAIFLIPESEIIEAVYAYCNLHDLWMCTPL